MRSQTARRFLKAVRHAGWLAVLILVLPEVGWTQVQVIVDCTGGPLRPGAFASITDALNNLDDQHHTIVVTGTCNETITIVQRSRGVTIEAPEGQTATIASPDPASNSGNVVAIFSSTQVVLRRLVIRGGDRGVQIAPAGTSDTSVLIEGCTIENNRQGVVLVSSINLTVRSAAPSVPTQIRNNSGLGIRSTSSFLNVENTTIANNGLTGIGVDGGHSTIGRDTIIEDNGGPGIFASGGELRLNAGPAEILIRNNAGGGVILNSSTSAGFDGRITIQNNGAIGVSVLASSATFSRRVLPDGTHGVTIIEGHSDRGLNISRAAEASLAGAHVIRNNGSLTASPFTRGGVRVSASASLTIGAATEITNNVGAGISAALNASVVVGSGGKITNNTEEGIRLALLSAAVISQLAATTTISGNGLANIACDGSSVVGGDLTGIQKVDCKIVK